MKKNIFITILALAALSFAIYSFTYKADDDTVDVAISEVTNTPEVETPEPEVKDEGPMTEENFKEAATDYNIKSGPTTFFDVGTRFNSIKKSKLDKVTAFSDFIWDKHAERIIEYKTLKVIVLEDSEPSDVQAVGTSGTFTEEQLQLLRTSDYATNLLIWADYVERDPYYGTANDSHWTPYLTVVPEKQAQYSEGKDAFISYFVEGSREIARNVDKTKVKPAKLCFTVSEDGTIKDIEMMNGSGYTNFDIKVMELMENMTGSWIPAENTEGEKVAQRLVLSFGNMGC